jgi:hypothetical protein
MGIVQKYVEILLLGIFHVIIKLGYFMMAVMIIVKLWLILYVLKIKWILIVHIREQLILV